MTRRRFTRGIWWVKRDFRLSDNDALCQAIDECEEVLALFIIEPSLCAAEETSYLHYQAWQQASHALDAALQRRNSRLHVLVGEVCDVLEAIYSNDGFDALYSHEETGSNITFARDKAVMQWAESHRLPWLESHQNGVIRGLRDRDQRSPVIRERLMETTPGPAPESIKAWGISKRTLDVLAGSHATGADIANLQAKQANEHWPDYATLSRRKADERIAVDQLQAVSESDAEKDWHSFLATRGIAYSGGISSPNTAFTAGSRLSTHLAWGTISLRRVFHDLYVRDKELSSYKDRQSIQWRKSLRAFQSRLHWHDHFMQRLESAPCMEYQAINPAYRNLVYGDNARLLEAWETGRTGLPIVDACMRCLASTGFLNFRMRAMVVSVACYGLAQGWRSLQYPLARLFRDYEPGIHFSQIQMQAGIVGINTIRIYSPFKQLMDHDPAAVFVKRWIPELREFDPVQIARYDEQSLGDYPHPITDIKSNTKIIRDQIYAIRQSTEGKQAAEQMLKEHGSRLAGNDRVSSAAKKSGRRGKSARSGSNPSSKQMSLDFDS